MIYIHTTMTYRGRYYWGRYCDPLLDNYRDFDNCYPYRGCWGVPRPYYGGYGWGRYGGDYW
jgi:hypothetical protein